MKWWLQSTRVNMLANMEIAQPNPRVVATVAVTAVTSKLQSNRKNEVKAYERKTRNNNTDLAQG